MSNLLPDMAERYWQLLLRGDADGLLDVFGGTPRIEDQRAGLIVGETAVRGFVDYAGAWLAELQAHVSPQRTTRGICRTVAEQDLHVMVGGRKVHLPTAIVAERGEGPRVDRIASYYSTWPLTGSHAVRPPVLEIDPELVLPDVVGRYMAALTDGYLQGVLDCYAEDAYVREPAGEPYTHRGRAGVREFYAESLADGGILLDHCTATDDGDACAVEYNAMKWGRTALRPQAGVAVYERDADGELIGAARIYDDVAPPPTALHAGPPAAGRERGL